MDGASILARARLLVQIERDASTSYLTLVTHSGLLMHAIKQNKMLRQKLRAGSDDDDVDLRSSQNFAESIAEINKHLDRPLSAKTLQNRGALFSTLRTDFETPRTDFNKSSDACEPRYVEHFLEHHADKHAMGQRDLFKWVREYKMTPSSESSEAHSAIAQMSFRELQRELKTRGTKAHGKMYELRQRLEEIVVKELYDGGGSNEKLSSPPPPCEDNVDNKDGEGAPKKHVEDVKERALQGSQSTQLSTGVVSDEVMRLRAQVSTLTSALLASAARHATQDHHGIDERFEELRQKCSEANARYKELVKLRAIVTTDMPDLKEQVEDVMKENLELTKLMAKIYTEIISTLGGASADNENRRQIARVLTENIKSNNATRERAAECYKDMGFAERFKITNA